MKIDKAWRKLEWSLKEAWEDLKETWMMKLEVNLNEAWEILRKLEGNYKAWMKFEGNLNEAWRKLEWSLKKTWMKLEES